MRALILLAFPILIGAVEVRAADPPPVTTPCFGGIYSTNPPAERLPPLDVDLYFTPLVRLGAKHESATREYVPISKSDVSMREAWYVAKRPFAGSVPLTSTGTVADVPSKPIVGYGWPSATPGMKTLPHVQTFRGIEPFTRSTTVDTIDSQHVAKGDRIPYEPTTNAFAFPRFRQALDRCASMEHGYVDALENDSMRLDFNRIWGNALAKITWKGEGGPRQIALDDDIGALVQAALWHGTEADTPGTCCLVNPTEAGGADIWNYSNTTMWAGSPVLSVTYGDTPGIPSITTQVRPMNFLHAPFEGTDAMTPLMWRGVFTKQVSLYGPYLELRFRARLDEPPVDARPTGMNQVFWLRANAWGDPETIVLSTYDARTDKEVFTPLPSYGDHVSFPHEPSLALMLATVDGTFAIGVIRGPSITRGNEYRLARWCANDENGESCDAVNSTLILDVHAFHNLSAEHDEEEVVYLTAGTAALVRERLQYACSVLGLGCGAQP